MRRSKAGFSFVELVVVLAVIAVVALLAGPYLKHRSKAVSRKQCVNNLKNIGLAHRIYSTDSGDAMVPEYMLRAGADRKDIDAARVYRSLSDELSESRLLICPADKMRKMGVSFKTLTGSNISYFASLSGDETLPQAFLGGDRNWNTNGVPVGSGPVTLTTNLALSYTATMHNREGNILMGDGSVQQWTSARLDGGKFDQDLGTNYLVFP
jgi:prepilin-type N-terminal cleavage/methylation domain-containing protein/prepilin-type processing-associated H-X9-DG protein